MDYNQLNSFLGNLEISTTEPSRESPLEPEQLPPHVPEVSIKEMETLKDETNSRINSYNNSMNFNLATNKQQVAGQIDFRSFMQQSSVNKNTKNNINEKLSSRDKILFHGGSHPTMFEMKPKNTRDINKTKHNF
tara:strand:+ start:461 stop:862 length:402 start_codon:yes stop_codon:yes gene_type:complete